MVPLRTFDCLDPGRARRMMSTSRERDIGETCGAVAPMANEAMRTTASGSGEKTTQVRKIRPRC